MIIKSMGHKRRSFKKLVAYIAKGTDKSISIAQNLMADSEDLAAVTAAFQSNADFLKARKNGNWCYHEMIALPDYASQSAASHNQLLELGKLYLKLRAPNQLAWGRVHTNTKHAHLHLIISANGLRSSKRQRLAKSEFAQIQERLEAFKLERWPELKESFFQKHIQKHNGDRFRRSNREGAMAKRQKKPSHREALASQIQSLLDAVRWPQELTVGLERLGYELYKRGQLWGLKETQTGRKHRLNRLGLSEAYQATLGRLMEREQQLSVLSQERLHLASSLDRTGDMMGPERLRVRQASNPSKL